MKNLGKILHQGRRRKVYEHTTDPTLVVKELIKPEDDHNQIEYDNWLWAVEHGYEKWLAECTELSEDGQYLFQRKGIPATAPTLIPAWIRSCRDFQESENWVEIDGAIVFSDYGDHPFGIEEVGNVYHGKEATDYDEKRFRKKQWQVEEAFMKEFLQKVKPKTVLDVPVGTGRFLPLYDCPVTGVDISYQMLQQAKKKASLLKKKYTQVYESIYNYTPKQVFDLVVCVRFLYWAQDLEILKKFPKWGRFTILSIWLGPNEIQFTDGKKFHKESDFNEMLLQAGLSVFTKKIIEQKKESTHYMFLLWSTL